MSDFSGEVESTLRRAGWFPHRRVDITRWKAALPDFCWHAAAEEFLEEFGGIAVDISGPGLIKAKERFEIDPELAVGEEDRFDELSGRFGRRFFPLGEVGNGEFFLAIDEARVIYLLASWVLSLGVVDAALEKLITGVPAERLSPPTGK